MEAQSLKVKTESGVWLREKNVCPSMMALYSQPVELYSSIDLRILRISDTQTSLNPDHKFAVGRGGHRIDASRNLWTGSGLKMESVSTDVAWGRGSKSHS